MSAVGGRYVIAFTYREPGRKTAAGRNLPFSDLRHEIAVVSREAERMRSSVGVLSARTYGILEGDWKEKQDANI